MKTNFLKTIGAFIALTSISRGALLWTTTFSGADGNSRALTNTNSAASLTDSLSATYANLTFQDTSFTGTTFMQSGNLSAGDHFSPRTNVDNPSAASPQNGGWWQSEFRYTGGTQTISLDSIVLDVVWTNSSGNRQAGDAVVRDITLTTEYSLDGGASWTAISSAQTYNLTVNSATALEQYQDRTFSFSSPLTVNDAIQDLWLRVKAENANTTAGAYVNIRDISFNGAVVPEPGVSLLSGLGVLQLLRRRR